MAHGQRRLMHRFLHQDGSMTGFSGDPEHYRWMTARLAAPLRARIAADVARLRMPAGALVLDIGTGPGLLPVEIARRSPQLWVTGVDVSPAMVEAARAAVEPDQQVTAEVADVAALPFADRSVDLVVSTLSQHHWPDLAAAVRELSRVLAPDGRLWIYDVRAALRTAQVAVELGFPAATVRVERVQAGLLGRFLARLTVEPAPVRV